MHSKWLKMLLAVIYVPLATEGLLRLMAPVPMMPRYVVAMPYGVRGNMPEKSYIHTTAEYRISIRTNSRGIRTDREIPYQKPQGAKRVVLLGDSFGFGYGVNADQMFTTRMCHYLQTKYGETVEVVNLATSGHGNAEELITLENEGFKYKPDLVLLAWHNTDLEDNVRSNLFELAAGRPIRKADAYLPAVKEREFLNQFRVYRFLTEKSQIYNFFRNWAGKNVKKWLAKIRLKKRPQKMNKEKLQRKSKKEYKSELTLAVLNRIQEECRLRDCKFMILDIPLRLTRTVFKSNFPFQYIGDDKDFLIVSPIAKFKEKRGRQLYWERGDGHFTPLGCDLVGEVLADSIEHHHLLDRSLN